MRQPVGLFGEQMMVTSGSSRSIASPSAVTSKPSLSSSGTLKTSPPSTVATCR